MKQTPYNEISLREQRLWDFMMEYGQGLEHTIPAETVASRLSVLYDIRCGGRTVQKWAALLRDHGYDIRGWKGGGGYKAGLFIPVNDEERRMAVAQERRTLSSHQRIHRVAERMVFWGPAGQGFMFDGLVHDKC